MLKYTTIKRAIDSYVRRSTQTDNDVLSAYLMGCAYGIAKASDMLPTLEKARKRYGFKLRETRWSV